jgi:hypothetical protein
MRQRLPWLIVLPLMVAGSMGAHALSRLLAGTPVEGAVGADVDGGSDRASVGVAAHSVLPIGVLSAFAVAVGVSWLLGRARGRRRNGASPWVFFVLPPLAFSAQELIERVVRAEAAPFHAAVEPRFLAGLALQVPFGLVALVVARLLLRAVRRIVQALVQQQPVLAGRGLAVLRLPIVFELPRIPALALGYPQRGPPTL